MTASVLRKGFHSASATAGSTDLNREKQPAIRCLDITVLMGGPSAEREVSLNSGNAVAAALSRCGHRVSCRDIGPHDLSALDVRADVIFVALHGSFGEDGQVQAILESRGLRYTGSDARSSQLAMNKRDAKKRFCEAGIPTPAYQVVTRREMNRVTECWKLPVILKPISEGSSVNVTIARDAFGFQSTLERLVCEYDHCLIEEYIRGPELTVGIVGDTALPVCEIKTPRPFYDYIAKYHDDDTEYSFTPDLPPALLREIQELSLRTHQALGCRDFSRVDWMVDAQSAQPYVLEVNTIPGFTDHSLLPKAAAHNNITFEALCQQIIELTIRRPS